MSEYSATYAERLEAGEEFQDFVADLFWERLGIPLVMHQSRSRQFLGENRQGIEIKFDRLFSRTGNLYVETHEKADPSNPRYVESGILRRDNSWAYAIGDRSCIYFFHKKVLQKLWRWRDPVSGEHEFQRKTIDTSRGFLLPVSVAKEWAVILRPKSDRVEF